MGATTKTLAKFLSKEGSANHEPWPKEALDTVWSHFDHGTQRAILRLYRSGAPEVLARAGENLGTVEAPALVLWGEQDPYIPEKFAQAYADVLPNAELNLLTDASHWPWFDRTDVVDLATDFLQNRNTSA